MQYEGAEVGNLDVLASRQRIGNVLKDRFDDHLAVPPQGGELPEDMR